MFGATVRVVRYVTPTGLARALRAGPVYQIRYILPRLGTAGFGKYRIVVEADLW